MRYYPKLLITYELKTGDRIEITLRGEIVGYVNNSFGFRPEGSECINWFTPEGLSQAKITRLEPELKVGPAEVRAGGQPCEVLAVDRGEAWVRFPDGSRGTWSVALLRNV